MKDKVPAFLFYPTDWISNPHIKAMTDQQYRAYHLLLCSAWLNDPQATLPNDDFALARCAEVAIDTWEQIKKPVLARFQLNGDGRLHHAKLTRVLHDARQKYTASKIRWEKTNEKRKNKENDEGGY